MSYIYASVGIAMAMFCLFVKWSWIMAVIAIGCIVMLMKGVKNDN